MGGAGNTMKALAVNGSPREPGNTSRLLWHCLDELKRHGIDCGYVSMAEKTVHGCMGCRRCFESGKGVCAMVDDFQGIYAKMLDADILITGSPVYFGSATPNIMALLDRAGYVARATGQSFSRKLGGPIVVARRAGQNFTYLQLLQWYLINDMVVPGSSYWNVGFGLEPGDVDNDEEALQTVTRFAENLAWLASKISD